MLVYFLATNSIMHRLLHVRLVLLRPHVLAAARRSLTPLIPVPIQPASSAETTLRRAVSALSIQSAVLAINILHTNLHSAYRILSSNAVFMTLSAATVIIAASLVPELDVTLETGGSSHSEVISKALQVLEEHQWQIEGSRGARRQLENFAEAAKKAKEHRDGNNLPTSHAPQTDSERLSLEMMDDLGIDFNDPLWSVQWIDPNFGSEMLGPYFNTSS
jgi:metal-responsive CopG/Arc/MetJ family transcriptional regulator